MSKNSEIIEDFKKSLSATIKSIGKKEDIEINFVKENPSIIGNTINLTEPKIENFKNNLKYLRAEADSFALEFRLHSKDIHQNFLNQDELSNEIINVLEQARVEAIGSSEFKGIQKNLKNKYIRDLKIGNTKKDQNLLIKAFKNVAFEEIVGVDLGEINGSFKNIVKEKLKKDYSNFFIDLKKCLHDQEKYTSTIVEKLDELGLFNNSVNNTQNEDINQNDEDQDNENENNDEQKNDEQTESNIEMQTSETAIEQSVSLEELGDLASYITINISSPNTKGLRDLQLRGNIEKLIKKIIDKRDEIKNINTKPILIKISPDLNEDQLRDIALISLANNIDGLILTNSTIKRETNLISMNKGKKGGLSGRPLYDNSNIILKKMYELTNGQIPLIGVGGISSGRDCYEKIKSGASLVQLYTALVYSGPNLINSMKSDLIDLIKTDGYKNLTQVIGKSA
ncbi:dihydroorotate dehydrogenase (quinone) [Pelagibacteraceae bacterium]|nr:dihydroorotate dehydrogenase (quinone) [Pelagibacteraceae bacterium]